MTPSRPNHNARLTPVRAVDAISDTHWPAARLDTLYRAKRVLTWNLLSLRAHNNTADDAAQQQQQPEHAGHFEYGATEGISKTIRNAGRAQTL